MHRHHRAPELADAPARKPLPPGKSLDLLPLVLLAIAPARRILGLDRLSPHGFTAAGRSDRHARGSRRQGHNGGVNIELLVVAKCPHERQALDLLHEVLAAAGLAQVDVHTTVIRTQSDAVTQGFVGSPTFLIDGVDPFTHNGQPPAVACRIYPTVAGLRGIPPRNDLLAAVLKASSPERNRPGS